LQKPPGPEAVLKGPQSAEKGDHSVSVSMPDLVCFLFLLATHKTFEKRGIIAFIAM